MDLDVIPIASSNPPRQVFHNSSGERVTFDEPREWCHISYYEMSNTCW